MTREETMNTNQERLHQRPVDGDVRTPGSPGAMKVCIVGASGKLGQYMVQHALDPGMRWLAYVGRKVSPSSTRSRDA